MKSRRKDLHDFRYIATVENNFPLIFVRCKLNLDGFWRLYQKNGDKRSHVLEKIIWNVTYYEER